MRKPDLAELEALLKNGIKELKDLDLSDLTLDGLDFSKALIENVCFAVDSTVGKPARKLSNLTFTDAVLKQVSFSEATLEECCFDGSSTRLESVSFKKCILSRCRFRGTSISWADFRYSEISNTTFESAILSYCDFYRSVFKGTNIFRSCKISNSTVVFEGQMIEKDNLYQNRILQEDKTAYSRFLKEREKFGSGGTKNDQSKVSDWDPDEDIAMRFSAAAQIYRKLNGAWTMKGLMRDASWAYVKGRRMERKHLFYMIFQRKDNSIFNRIKLFFHFIENGLVDTCFGYGESLKKTMGTFAAAVFLFAFIFYALPFLSLGSYVYALLISLRNMVAMTDSEITGINPLVDILNIIQTTIGILIIGIYGYILGNKIRNNQ